MNMVLRKNIRVRLEHCNSPGFYKNKTKIRSILHCQNATLYVQYVILFLNALDSNTINSVSKIKYIPIFCGNPMTVITFRFSCILGKNSTIQGFQNL